MKIVEVIWQDARMEDNYLNEEGISGMKCLWRSNVGYLQREDDESVVISFGLVYDNETIRDDNFIIPRGVVTEIRDLK